MIQPYKSAVEVYLDRYARSVSTLDPTASLDRWAECQEAASTREMIARSFSAFVLIAADPELGAAYGPEPVRLSMISELAREYESAEEAMYVCHYNWRTGAPIKTAAKETNG